MVSSTRSIWRSVHATTRQQRAKHSSVMRIDVFLGFCSTGTFAVLFVGIVIGVALDTDGGSAVGVAAFLTSMPGVLVLAVSGCALGALTWTFLALRELSANSVLPFEVTVFRFVLAVIVLLVVPIVIAFTVGRDLALFYFMALAIIVLLKLVLDEVRY